MVASIQNYLNTKILISKNWYLNIEYFPAFARCQTGPKQNLNEEEREYIHDFHDEKGDHHRIVNDVLNTAKEKQKEAKDKERKFKRGDGSVVILRDVFSKIVDSITKFQGAVDFLVSMDTSGHVALPWAGVKYLLSVRVFILSS
jgi:flagellar hook-basal body complex protein FliE